MGCPLLGLLSAAQGVRKSPGSPGSDLHPDGTPRAHVSAVGFTSRHPVCVAEDGANVIQMWAPKSPTGFDRSGFVVPGVQGIGMVPTLAGGQDTRPSHLPRTREWRCGPPLASVPGFCSRLQLHLITWRDLSKRPMRCLICEISSPKILLSELLEKANTLL